MVDSPAPKDRLWRLERRLVDHGPTSERGRKPSKEHFWDDQRRAGHGRKAGSPAWHGPVGGCWCSI